MIWIILFIVFYFFLFLVALARCDIEAHSNNSVPWEDHKMKSDFGLSNWGSYIVNKLIHPFTVSATPVFVLILTIYFIVHAFRISIYSGVRSFAGVLFPLIIMTFIYIFNRELLTHLGKLNVPVSFIGSLIWGIIVMVVIRFFGPMYSASIPISELILSGSFSILIFSYVQGAQSKLLSYYYGMISGFLLYIIFFGFPL